MLVFVRHGESIGNILSQDQRVQLETPNFLYSLTNTGIKQSDIVGRFLREKYGRDFFDFGFYSDFLRAKQTFNRISSKLDCFKMVTKEDCLLNEKWDGIFHEMSTAQIFEKYPEQIKARKNSGYYMHRAPGGENVPDVEMRVRMFLAENMQILLEKNVLVVGHGRWFQIFLKFFHGWTAEDFMKKFDDGSIEKPNCSVSIYDKYAIQQRTLGVHIVPWQGLIEETKTEMA